MPAFNLDLIRKVYRYVIKRYKPDNTERSAVIRMRLAMLYAFVGWQGFIYAVYLSTKDAMSTEFGEPTTKMLQEAQKKGKTIEYTHIKGLTIVEKKIMTGDANGSVSSDE